MTHVLDAARRANAQTIDITGGAPEMHPHFQRFIAAARRQGHRVIIRTNLTILLEPGYEAFPAFFRDQRVRLIASLPCYLEENVRKQRGANAYQPSIDAIRKLNQVGFGIDPDLVLDLVFNPVGPSLPPSQARLEQDYRKELNQRYNLQFSNLIAITNLPIGRFLTDLEKQGRAEEYFELLKNAFNPATVDGLMCRHQLHVGYDGTLYDCDFNFALALPASKTAGNHIRNFDPHRYRTRAITTDNHCLGCTAGAGSSCGGELIR